MNSLILFLTFTAFVSSFKLNHRNFFRNTNLYALKNYNEKPYNDMDIFEKFEKYSNERNKEKQSEYLYKIKKFLERKYKKKNWEKNLKE